MEAREAVLFPVQDLDSCIYGDLRLRVAAAVYMVVVARFARYQKHMVCEMLLMLNRSLRVEINFYP